MLTSHLEHDLTVDDLHDESQVGPCMLPTLQPGSQRNGTDPPDPDCRVQSLTYIWICCVVWNICCVLSSPLSWLHVASLLPWLCSVSPPCHPCFTVSCPVLTSAVQSSANSLCCRTNWSPGRL